MDPCPETATAYWRWSFLKSLLQIILQSRTGGDLRWSVKCYRKFAYKRPRNMKGDLMRLAVLFILFLAAAYASDKSIASPPISDSAGDWPMPAHDRLLSNRSPLKGDMRTAPR